MIIDYKTEMEILNGILSSGIKIDTIRMLNVPNFKMKSQVTINDLDLTSFSVE